MARSGIREATFSPTGYFEETFRSFSSNTPAIKERLKDFKEAKKKRPPDRFGNDHELNGRLEGIHECHLAGNVCLLFTDKNDVVTLLAVCNHDELQGGRAKSLAKKIRKP